MAKYSSLKFRGKVYARYKAAKDNVEVNWKGIYQEAQKFATPNRRGGWDGEATTKGGNKDGSDVYDSTAALATKSFVSNTMLALTPTASRWAHLEALEDKTKTQEIDEVNNTVHQVLQESNFYKAASSAYADLAIGTGALFLPKGNQKTPLDFTAVPLSQVYPEQTNRGIIGTAFRCYEVTLPELAKDFPEVKANSWFRKLKKEHQDKEDHKIKIIEASLEGIWDEDVWDTAKGDIIPNVPTFGYKYMVFTEKDKHLVTEYLNRTNPWIIFRWSQLTGETLGRGPVLECFADIERLNKAVGAAQQAEMLTLNPPRMAQPEIAAEIQKAGGIKPGLVIVKNGFSGTDPISNFPLDASSIKAEPSILRLRNVINQHFDVEPLGTHGASTPATATEVQLRSKAYAEKQAANYTRLEHELLRPLVLRVLEVLFDLGKIELPFKLGANGSDFEEELDFKLRFITPLEKSKKTEDLNDIMSMVQFAGSFGEAGMATLNIQEIMQKFAEVAGIDKKLLATQEQINRAAAMAQQQVLPQPEAQPE